MMKFLNLEKFLLISRSSLKVSSSRKLLTFHFLTCPTTQRITYFLFQPSGILFLCTALYLNSFTDICSICCNIILVYSQTCTTASSSLRTLLLPWNPSAHYQLLCVLLSSSTYLFLPLDNHSSTFSTDLSILGISCKQICNLLLLTGFFQLECFWGLSLL